MTTKPLDLLLAFKAISLTGSLTDTERRVAAVLLDHFNRKTGQCDPGMQTIAGLLGLSTRSIMRAVAGLDRKKLFSRTVHGGKFYRNSYSPNWRALKQLEVDWKSRRVSISRNCERPSVSPTWRQHGHRGADAPVTQTYSYNQSSKPNDFARSEMAASMQGMIGASDVATKDRPVETHSLGILERELRKWVSVGVFDAWFADLEVVCIGEDEAVFSTSTKFRRDYVASQWDHVLLRMVNLVHQPVRRVDIVVRSQGQGVGGGQISGDF